MSGPPDYVGVGTRRAGAEWWHSLLLAHPQVQPRPRSQRAESFFTPFAGREMTQGDVDSYHRGFPRAAGRLTGEWSPDYLHEPWTPLLLARAAPQARLLVMLGDPVERFRRRLRVELIRGNRETAAYRTPDALTRGLYATQLRQLWNWFDRGSTLVLQYERCLADPRGQYERTLRFLGLRDDFVPRARIRPVLRARAEQALRRATRGTLWPDLETALLDALEPEMRDLRVLAPEVDFALWPEVGRLVD